MTAIDIGTNLPKDKVSDIISSSVFSSQMNCISFKNRDIYSFKIENNDFDDIFIYSCMADLVQNIINKIYMRKLVENRTAHLLRGFIEDDFIDIIDTVYELILDKNKFKKEKMDLREEIRDYLMTNKSIIIDGYLRFRSASFTDLIDKIVEKVVIEKQMGEEYNDFINMLKYYIELQPPKIDIVNIVIKADEFILMDNRKNIIECRSITDIQNEDLSKEDVLLSSLIILSPRNIIVHIKNDKEKELMNILKSLFNQKLKFCYTCKICDD